MALIALDALLPLPAGLRLATAAGLLALAGFAGRRLLHGLRRVPPEAVAQRAELLGGVADNAIINACQFEAQSLPPAEAAWLPPTSAAAAVALERSPVPRLLRLPQLLRVLAGLALAVAAVIGGALIWPDHLAHGARRLLLPLADLPPLGAAVITVEPAGTLTLDDGAELSVRVRLRPADGRRRELPAPQLVFEDEREAPALRQLDGLWQVALPGQHRASAFRISCAGTLTPLVRVVVLPPPTLTVSRFVVDGPAYTGLSGSVRPGPPAALNVLPGSVVRLSLSADCPLAAVHWQLPGGSVELARDGDGWSGSATLSSAGAYRLIGDGRQLAQGEIRLEADRPPEATLGGAERNRYVDPGTTLDLPLTASDDLGLAAVTVLVREAVDGAAPSQVQAWQLLGPPGPRELAETLHLALDPARFLPGRAYLCEAVASDRLAQEGRSPPLVLRVRTVKDLALPPGDRRASAFEALRRCLAEQIRARAASGNLLANLAEIRAHRTLPAQASAASGAQEAARLACVTAIEVFTAASEGAVLPILRPIADPAMPQLREALASLDETGAAQRLPPLIREQDDLIARLTALLGTIAAEVRQERKPVAGASAHEADRKRAEELKQDLERFLDDQKRILERSRTLADGGGADLTADEERIAGELVQGRARVGQVPGGEADQLRAESAPGLQRRQPGDRDQRGVAGRQAGRRRPRWQEGRTGRAARAVRHRERFEKLVNNLEKWLSPTPPTSSSGRWRTPQAPADVAVAELPAELEDIVGELLDKAEEMTPDVQDATSAWMDSLDKGAGWTAADGPISNMSAKGITGNVLPNQSEIGGRSGEGPQRPLQRADGAGRGGGQGRPGDPDPPVADALSSRAASRIQSAPRAEAGPPVAASSPASTARVCADRRPRPSCSR